MKAMADGDKLIAPFLPPAVSKPLKDKKIRPMFIVTGSLVLFTLFFLFVCGQHMQSGLVNTVGFLYPMVMSFKAIKSESKDDDTQWLIYWLVYGFLNMVESITDILFDWLPLYYPLKAGLLVWLFLPQTKGATLLFKIVLDPIVTAQLAKVDSQLKKATVTKTTVADDADKVH